MKKIKIAVIFYLFTGVCGFCSYAQQVLPEITILARNYRYLSAVNQDAAPDVLRLQYKAASYNIKSSEIYQDDYDSYSVNFYLPSGYILAVYDASGKLLSTAERYKNIALPAAVRAAVGERFPNWTITSDTYKVNYNEQVDARVVYKIVLQHGNKQVRVKLTDEGKFLD